MHTQTRSHTNKHKANTDKQANKNFQEHLDISSEAQAQKHKKSTGACVNAHKHARLHAHTQKTHKRTNKQTKEQKK